MQARHLSPVQWCSYGKGYAICLQLLLDRSQVPVYCFLGDNITQFRGRRRHIPFRNDSGPARSDFEDSPSTVLTVLYQGENGVSNLSGRSGIRFVQSKLNHLLRLVGPKRCFYSAGLQSAYDPTLGKSFTGGDPYQGQIVVTFTPSIASHDVMDLTKPTIACLVAQYRGVAYIPSRPANDDMMQTTPFFCLPKSARTAIRVSLIGWLTFMATEP